MSGGQKQLKGGPSDLSPLRSDNSFDGQAGRLGHLTDGQRHSKLSSAERELPGSSPLRSDGSCSSQAGGWMDDWWPKVLKWELENNSWQPGKLLGNYQAQVHSDQMVLVVVRREAGWMTGGQRCSNESWKTTLYSQGNYLKTGMWWQPRSKTWITLSQGMLKKVRCCRWRWWGLKHNSHSSYAAASEDWRTFHFNPLNIAGFDHQNSSHREVGGSGGWSSLHVSNVGGGGGVLTSL